MISAFLITHQCMVLDYCLDATIRSIMDFCDDVYINDGNSTDGTKDIINSLATEFGKDRIKVWYRDWVYNRSMWANEKNFLLDKMTNNDYILAVDADEVFHEDEFVLIHDAIKGGFKSIAFHVIHFYGRPTHFIEGPAWYKEHTRLWHKSTGIKLLHREGGCADDLVWPNGLPAHVVNKYNCGANIYHYGNCRDPRALGMKSKKADDLYQYSNAYSGGKISGPRSFSYAFDKVGAKLFEGSQPKYIKSWYDKHKDQPTEFYVDDGEANKLWCFN